MNRPSSRTIDPHIDPTVGFAERLARATDQVAATRAAYEDALALRASIIVEARDQGGLSYLEISRLAEVSPSRVVAIVATAGN